jgi:hypothetical protein
MSTIDGMSTIDDATEEELRALIRLTGTRDVGENLTEWLIGFAQGERKITESVASLIQWMKETIPLSSSLDADGAMDALVEEGLSEHDAARIISRAIDRSTLITPTPLGSASVDWDGKTFTVTVLRE